MSYSKEKVNQLIQSGRDMLTPNWNELNSKTTDRGLKKNKAFNL